MIIAAANEDGPGDWDWDWIVHQWSSVEWRGLRGEGRVGGRREERGADGALIIDVCSAGVLEWGWFRRVGMGWDGMGWDGMGWDGMGWDGMGRDGTRWDASGCLEDLDRLQVALAGLDPEIPTYTSEARRRETIVDLTYLSVPIAIATLYTFCDGGGN
ncbi:hypothetical protein VTL71DRAFT_1514 [Oculimacula yallundae]|uniref:Uncharacterized protein n=1 Tax=Oculimacula yallundae TaxID=86028 RepID=A0ABR4CBD3_9HELO